MTIWDGKFYKLDDGRIIGPVTSGRDPANGRLWVYCPKLQEHFEKCEIECEVK